MQQPSRFALVALALCFGATLMSGCFGGAPLPTPSPTPTGFASDEEAYAAAEKTFDDYVRAENLRREGRVGPDPMSFLSGAAADDYTAAQADAEAKGLTPVGSGKVTAFEGMSTAGGSLVARACYDQSRVRAVDASGADVTSAERPDQVALELEFSLTREPSLRSQRVIGQC
ncbi:hypothetical protein [uncultured Microbacterium sp.]|uniref:hypothetical protein n=1 Tax=uncultured Microbacterium sp. TaxID=191216 RepID=UPI0025F83AE3|nr:hypothetical protein [uncultured Microbacterium sp.]